jgi:hypothetical protein
MPDRFSLVACSALLVAPWSALAVFGCGNVVDASTGPVMAYGYDAQTSDGAPCAPGFATQVPAVAYGPGAGFGQSRMPDVVLGPPRGTGVSKGSADVLSLGVGGQIVVGFGQEGIADGPGPDFGVFENVFWVGGDPDAPFVEPGAVSVSFDGQNWVDFPCQPLAPTYEGCAGRRAVSSSPDNSISPFDPEQSGGDWFDLADVGLSAARYVRIRDLSASGAAASAGFDLDAVAVRNPACAQ